MSFPFGAPLDASLVPFLETSAEAFAARHAHPFLVLVSYPGAAPDTSGLSPVQTWRAVGKLAPHPGPPRVFPVAKREGANAFGYMITIGRADNNDIVISHRAISKFHAYLSPLGKQWWLSDGNSLNGTFVEGSRLPAERKRPLKPGARLSLSEHVLFEFLEADGFYRVAWTHLG